MSTETREEEENPNRDAEAKARRIDEALSAAQRSLATAVVLFFSFAAQVTFWPQEAALIAVIAFLLGFGVCQYLYRHDRWLRLRDDIPL